MRTRDYMNILKTIAEHEKTSIEEVETEMQRAIDIGFDNPDKKYKKNGRKFRIKGIDLQSGK